MSAPECPFGKVRHPDRQSARIALRRTGGGRKAGRQIFRCGLCGGWHVSSQSRAQYLMWPGRRRAHTSTKETP